MHKDIIKIIETALSEDKVKKDLTSKVCIDEHLTCKAVIIAKQKGILAGVDICGEVFRQINNKINFKAYKKDGQAIRKNEIIAEISGKASSILSAERCALNFLSFLSGIATKTNKIVMATCQVSPTKKNSIKILDTRKTMPLLRAISKYAVKVGGGVNHRMNLADGILIKDNHLKFISITDAVNSARKKIDRKFKIEVEVENLSQVRQAKEAGADIIMLDNMDVETMKKAIQIINRASKIEVSGGITKEKIKKLRHLKIDYISMGSLTNNITPVDFSLEIK